MFYMIRVMEKNKQNGCSAWSFHIDDVENFSYIEDGFSKEECKEIIDIGNAVPKQKGLVSKGYIAENREANISWLFPSDGMTKYYRKLTDMVLGLNRKFFNFDLWGFTEGLQFTHYTSTPKGFHEKHQDKYMKGVIRKLSIIIQLSDPKDYEGGDIKLHLGGKPQKITKKAGHVIVFPSYVLHQVTPVTKGERYALVGWVTGPKFK